MYLCIDDMKRIFYMEEGENDPIIEKWLNECGEIHDSIENKYNNEKNLRRCPICRS